MIVMLHVFIAISSITVTTAAFFAPSQLKLRTAYGLAGLTLASGLYLVISEPAHMLQACMSGVAYLAVVSVGIAAARHKLMAAQHNI